MSPKRKKTEPAEGWESLAEEEPGGSLAPNAELEEALREAAEAVEKRHEAGAQLEPPKDDSPEADPLDETISLDKPLPKLAGEDATRVELLGKATGELAERHTHLHANAAVPAEVWREISSSLRDLSVQLTNPVESSIEDHLYEGEAALPSGMVSD